MLQTSFVPSDSCFLARFDTKIFRPPRLSRWLTKNYPDKGACWLHNRLYLTLFPRIYCQKNLRPRTRHLQSINRIDRVGRTSQLSLLPVPIVLRLPRVPTVPRWKKKVPRKRCELFRGLRSNTILNTSTVGQTCHEDKRASEREREAGGVPWEDHPPFRQRIIPTREI